MNIYSRSKFLKMNKFQLTFLFIALYFMTSCAQSNYDTLWKKVEQFEKEGLPKSALKEVSNIISLAKKEKNNQQNIKALLFKSKYVLTLEEDAQLKIINEFKKEIESANTITKSILRNILATLYWDYFKEHRWNFKNRSYTSAKTDGTDFRTWDLQTLFTAIDLNYEQSLKHKNLLQKENIKDYELLLVKAKSSELYRPTLYDILAHNALEFYKTDENSLTKPAYKFMIDQDDYFGRYYQFIKTKITSKDTASTQLKALKIYQDLMTLHLNDKSLKAKIQIDIERLNFVYRNAVQDHKDDLYTKCLKQEIDKISDSPESALYVFELAKFYKNKGRDFDVNAKSNPKNASKQGLLKEALELCDEMISKFPDSKGTQNCKVLKSEILKPSLVLKVESHIPIKQLSRILVTSKNIESLDIKILKVNQTQLDDLNKIYDTEQIKSFVSNFKPLQELSVQLKTVGDYQNHSQEILLPALDHGLYLVYAKSNASEKVFAISHLQITNLALVENTINNKHIYQVINRLTGAPISGANVSVNYTPQRNRAQKYGAFITDAQGRFTIKRNGNYYRNIQIDVKFKQDHAIFGNYYINRFYKNNPISRATDRATLFTDRSIYRPGQTLYFKGILTQTLKKQTKILPNQDVLVLLKNVNYETVSQIKLKTNGYGSFQSQFVLPNGGLTGSFKILVQYENYNIGSNTISVEEYKRPKFKVDFPPITTTFKVNDNIKINGQATAFAGSVISDAKVVYRVKRQVQYPKWYYWRYSRGYNSEAQEIAYGKTLTNQDGSFTIPFRAIPDASVSKNNQPIFNYEITADVTDINGETRSATTIVSVGYHSMTAQMDLPIEIDKQNQSQNIKISTQNLNGEFVPAKGQIKIYKLKAPDQVLRDRPWNAPDLQTWSETEFKNQFPYDAYTDEDQQNKWDKGKLVKTLTFDTESSKTVKLGNIKSWQQGRYVLQLTSQDPFGQNIISKVFTTITNSKAKEVFDNRRFMIKTDKTSYNTNDIAELTLGSAAKTLVVTLDIEKQGKIIDTKIISLNNEVKTVSIPVSKNDLGGFVVHYKYAYQNSFNNGTLNISVPYPKTDLEIETITFRDRLRPGEDETWKFKIKGPKGDKVSAELLASMYDASLDEFKPHQWQYTPIIKPIYYAAMRTNGNRSFGVANLRLYNRFAVTGSYSRQQFDKLNWFGLNFARQYMYKNARMAEPAMMMDDSIEIFEDSEELEEVVVVGYAEETKEAFTGSAKVIKEEEILNQESIDKSSSQPLQIRKNLQETAFFFPQLHTDEEGNVSFSFTSPEALTRWKLQLLAHTKTLETAISKMETVTQKELMVIPNVPRFLRESDKITISTKISNLTEKELSGTAILELSDAITGKLITLDLIKFNGENTTKVNQDFSIKSKGNTSVSWSLLIPDNVQVVQYKVIAKAGDFSDGEQNALPVLSNRMLVTETMPMWVSSNDTRTFTLDKLKNNTSQSLKHHQLTLEMTSNPAWYAVQALPYLMEYPYECNEQIFSRFYANALAQHIATSNPKIEAVFNQWKSADALMSNLEKNQELKSLLIQETPWLRDAQSETEQKKRMALLFDMNQMKNELASALSKLKSNQMNSGGWAWFKGGYENRFITQHIITGFGHLSQLNVIDLSSRENSRNLYKMVEKAVYYLDKEFVEEYERLKKYKKDVDLSQDHLSYSQLHYLYMRSFFKEVEASTKVKDIMNYYHGQIKKYWLKRSLYAKGLMTLISYRNNDIITSNKILKSLKENSITNEELGMYWKTNTSSWYWYQAPIETQALMIEAFSEAGKSFQNEKENTSVVDHLKIWLLKNKQTNKWETTKATADAIYALLLQGSNWLAVDKTVEVTIGQEKITETTLKDVKVEAGTGYYKLNWSGTEIQPEQATVTLSKKGEGIAWGGLYWQYFEDLDKITAAETPLKLRKKIFLKKNTEKGEEITEINSNTKLNIGDLVRVRIELRSDRDMEFVHLKDMRAAGFEPINVLSRYKWQDGLGYYQSTKDAATNFFFDFLPKGIYVFEYDLRVNNSGDMSHGISTIQSMYAPEFSSHSRGIRVKVE